MIRARAARPGFATVFTEYEDSAVDIVTANESGATFHETLFHNAAEVDSKAVGSPRAEDLFWSSATGRRYDA